MVLFVLVFSLGAIAGHLVGTIITQQQFDNINFQTKSLEISVDSKIKTESKVLIGLSYSTLEKTDDGNWEVVLREKTLVFPLENYHTCRVDGNTRAECTQLAVNFLKSQGKVFRQSVRQSLEDQQTREFFDELSVQDFNITSSELNEG